MSRKRKIALLAVALGLTVAAASTPRAEALPRYCNTGCTSQTSPTYPCTCPGTTYVTTCGQWQNVCL